jgi:hypothetical protein
MRPWKGDRADGARSSENRPSAPVESARSGRLFNQTLAFARAAEEPLTTRPVMDATPWAVKAPTAAAAKINLRRFMLFFLQVR